MLIKINSGEFQGNAKRVTLTIEDKRYLLTHLTDDTILIEKVTPEVTEHISIVPITPKQIIIK